MKRLQVMLKDEIFGKLESIVSACNEGFDEGRVRIQDVVEAIVTSSSVDISKIRARCMDVNKILRNAKITTRTDLKNFVKKLGLVEHLLDGSEDS